MVEADCGEGTSAALLRRSKLVRRGGESKEDLCPEPEPEEPEPEPLSFAAAAEILLAASSCADASASGGTKGLEGGTRTWAGSCAKKQVLREQAAPSLQSWVR